MMEQETREKYRVRDKKIKEVRQGEPWGRLCTWGPREIQGFYCLILKDE